MFRFKSRAGCVWDPVSRRGTAENKKTKRQTTGTIVGKQTQTLDSPPERFVICAHGVCGFYQTPQEKHKDQGIELLSIYIYV